jgi:DNA polymerase III delta prime subunit
MSKELKLEDFLPGYPFLPDVMENLSDDLFDLYHDTYDNANFRKKEFYLSKLEQIEPRPKEAGVPLKHQSFLAKFLSPRTLNDEMLLFHGMGSGKTCSVVMIAELAKKINPALKPALVLVKGGTLRRNFIKELVFKCTKGQYIPDNFDSLTNEEKTRRINKLVGQNYEFATFETFTTHVIDKYSTEQLKKTYSNRIIIIDEAQHLRIHAEKSEKKKLDVYQSIHRFLHSLENCKKLILSGTPMIDRPEELASIMNLLLPLDNQLPTGKQFLEEYFSKGSLKSKEKLQDILRGRVSYLRSMESSIVKLFEGKVQAPLKKMPVVPLEMSKFQAKVYIQAYNDDIGAGMSDEEKQKLIQREVNKDAEEPESEDEPREERKSKEEKGLYDQSRQASMFVFPDETYGSEGFNNGKWIKQKTKQKLGKDTKMKQIKTNEFSLTKEFTDILTNKGQASVSQIIKNISKYSCKFSQAIQEIILHPQDNTFVYSKFVYGSGAILFGELLKLVGFSRSRARESVEDEEEKEQKKPKEKKKATRTIFSKEDMTDQDFNNLLTQEMEENQQTTQKILEEEKDIEPTSGKRYAIITGETAGETEIDRILDKFNSPKNKYGEYIQVIIGSQVIGEGKSLNNVRRIIVLTPHWNNSETEQAIARGIRAFSHEDLPKGEQVVHVYRYVAQTPTVKSIDAIMYKTSEDKDLLIKQLERVCKETAVDCALNYKRNKLSSDINGNRECEYQSCQYMCASDPSSSPDLIEDTYNLFYAEDTIENLIRSVQQLFRTRFSYDLVELTTNLPDISQIILIRSLKMMIEKSIPIINRYGLTSYLREENNFYFLVDKIEYPASFPLEYYNRFPNIQPKIHFSDIVSISEYKYFSDISNKIQRLDPIEQRDEIIKIITGLKTDLKEMFFEYAIIARLLNVPKHVQLRNLIIGIFTNSTFQMEDGSFVSLIDENNSKCLPSKAIKDFTKSKDISLLKWRACNDSDKKTIASHKTGIKSSLEKNEYGCYGKVGENQKFRIKFLEEHKDTRKNSTGIVCSTINPKERIFEILVKVKADPPVPLNISDRTKPIRELLSNKKLPYTEKQLFALSQKDFERIYYWYTKVQKQSACKSLQDWFEEHNLLVYEESDKKKKEKKK